MGFLKMEYKPIKKEVMSDHVVSQLKTMIINKKVKIGDKLPNERELSQLFEVSRSTIREALRVLELQGLLNRTNAGTFVQAEFSQIIEESIALEILLNRAKFQDVQSARVMLEGELIRLASINYKDENLVNLQRYIERMEKSIKEKDKQSFIEADIAFHNEIAVAANNQVMLFLYQTIADLIFKLQQKAVFDEEILNVSLEYHKLIFQHFQNGNVEEAKNKLIEHLSDVETRLHRLEEMENMIWQEIQP